MKYKTKRNKINPLPHIVSFQFHSHKLVTCSDDATVKIWDLDTSDIIDDVKQHHACLFSLLLLLIIVLLFYCYCFIVLLVCFYCFYCFIFIVLLVYYFYCFYCFIVLLFWFFNCFYCFYCFYRFYRLYRLYRFYCLNCFYCFYCIYFLETYKFGERSGNGRAGLHRRDVNGRNDVSKLLWWSRWTNCWTIFRPRRLVRVFFSFLLFIYLF
jgi:hypothetical protein